MTMSNLPIHTQLFDENREGGLLLCGINHGYSQDDARLDAEGADRSDPYKSFFSDRAMSDYWYRNRVVERFRL